MGETDLCWGVVAVGRKGVRVSLCGLFLEYL